MKINILDAEIRYRASCHYHCGSESVRESAAAGHLRRGLRLKGHGWRDGRRPTTPINPSPTTGADGSEIAEGDKE